MSAPQEEPPPRVIGPDPRLNGRGVALTWRQRGILAGIALAIGAALVFVLFGIPYGLPGGSPVPVYRAVVDGSGRAEVRVEQDGTGASTAEVTLPWSVAVDRGTSVVAVEARAVGDAQDLTCSVVDAGGAPVPTLQTAGGGATVRCDATVR